MTYSTELEELIDLHMSSNKELEKKKLPEGVSYMLNGNMCFGVYDNYLVLRTTQDNAEKLTRKPGFSEFQVNGKSRKGWLMVAPIIYRNPKLLRKLLSEGLRCTSALPSK